MSGGCNAGRRRLRESDGVSPSSKFGLIRCYLLSAGLSSAGVWPDPTKAELAPLRSVVLRIYKIAAGIDLGPMNQSDEVVLGITGYPSSETMINAERLSMLTRIIAKRNVHVLTALAASTRTGDSSIKPRCWVNAADGSLLSVTGEGKQAIDTASSFAERCEALSENTKAF